MAGERVTTFARSNSLGILAVGTGPYERGLEEAVRTLLASLAIAAEGVKLKKGNAQITLDCALQAIENGSFAIVPSDQPSHVTVRLSWSPGELPAVGDIGSLTDR